MIPTKVKELFERTQLVSFGTADKEGNPNVVPILWKRILDGGKIILLDNFMRASKENVLRNNRVCLSVWDPESEEAYKLKGTAVYHSRGPVYEAGREFMQADGGDQVPRGVVEVTVTEVYAIKPGPDAGMRIM
ncbi:MAG: pyridoxamine 5'-phosphate oxidase family protein [Candidatus Altiarchaeota archaeon]|nr:pyridoxamine 5'-phosphate oxidase family protein [Candidatus Altiarchaeota archaeon]